MARIAVNPVEPGVFEVAVTDGGSTTVHRVTADAETTGRLAPDLPPEAIVEASFRFLLDREPKESILRSFDLPVISRYFPEFDVRLDEYLDRGG